jgi:hypothetical protein
MLPRVRSHRAAPESGILPCAGDARQRAADVERDEPLSPEEERLRRAYAEWLARFDKTAA